MAVETLVEPPPSTLSGVARVLVNAGKLNAKTAEEIGQEPRASARAASSRRVIGAGAMKSDDLAHTLSGALALPLLDLNAVDAQKLPRNIVDQKIASQYQLVVLGKRGNRLFIGAADPTDQEAVERIKFATQLTPEWVIVEYDKLHAPARGAERQRQRGAGDRWPAATSTSTSPTTTPRPPRPPTSRPRSRTRRSCASCRRC